MRLLLCGSSKIFAIENVYRKYLEEAGEEVAIYPSNDLFFDYLRKPWKKILHKLRISNIEKSINSSLIELVQTTTPDVVWVFKGMELWADTIKQIKILKVVVINYNPDNPFIFTGIGSGNVNVSDSIVLFDLHLTYNKWVQNELRKRFDINAFYLPFGFEISDELYKKARAFDEIVAVCFIGNPDQTRAWFILGLLDKGIKIHLYGHNWNKFIRHPNATLHIPVLGDELYFTLRRYRIQLNLMRPHNLDSHNMRTFEIPGIGGVMLAPATTEHNTFFESGKEAFLFKDINHCCELISLILNMSNAEISLVREAARNRSLRDGYSYKQRSLEALRTIKSIL